MIVPELAKTRSADGSVIARIAARYKPGAADD